MVEVSEDEGKNWSIGSASSIVVQRIARSGMSGMLR